MKRIASTVLVGLFVALVVLPACGKKTDETVRAAGITPATALGFLSLNLSPSIEQKRNLLSIARRFPDARTRVKAEFDDTVDSLLAEILEDSGLNYSSDVKPWLGNEAAIAVLPPGDADEPLLIAMVQTEDEAKAKAAITKAKASGDFTGAYAIVDDFVVISDQTEEEDNQPALDQIVAQGKRDDGGLAKSDEFNDVVDKLHGDRLILGWLDVKDALKTADDLGGFDGVEFLDRIANSAPSIAFDLHAEERAIVFQGVGRTTGDDKSREAKLTASLPATTLAALTLFNLDSAATQVIEGVIGGSRAEGVAQLEQITGLDVDKDILSWMGGEAVLVAGPVRDNQPFPDFALVVEPTDRAKAEAGLAKIRQVLGDQGIELEERQIAGATAYTIPGEALPGIQPAMALFEDRFIVANSPAYLGDLAKAATPGLGSTDAYTSVIQDGKSNGQFVVLIDPVREAIEKAVFTDGGEDRTGYERDVRPNLEPLSAFGASATRDGDYSKVEVRVTFD